MANYGPHGVATTLVPFDPIPRMKSEETFEERWLTELGLIPGGCRSGTREEADAEFARVCGSEKDAVLTEERFIAAAAQLWAFDRRSARACFHAADVDNSGRMSRQEYVLFREAFVHPPSEFSSHESVRRLQLQAIFNKYVLSRPAQRDSRDDAMTSDELFEFVRDLCAGDAHTRQVADSLMPLFMKDMVTGEAAEEEEAGDASPTRGKITVGRFVEALSTKTFHDKLVEHGLTARDLTDCLRNPGRGHSYPMRYPRAVLDGRAETALLRAPWRSKLRLSTTSIGLGHKSSSTRSVDRAGVSSLAVQPEAVNAEMQLDPHVRAVGGWRGPMAPSRESQEFIVAMKVIERAMQLARDLPAQTDVLDCHWLPRGAALRLLLGKDEAQQAKCIQTLAQGCQSQLAAQPSLVRVPAPAKVFGDVHGQLRDLLLMFGLYGPPTHCGGDVQTTSYVFNGDWVDRGEHQLEVVLLLFALKTVYPSQVFLVRGNHEFRDMSEGMEEDGFLFHMQQQLPTRWSFCYEAVHQAFDWLPLAALVGGVVLVLHGGIGDGSWGLKDLEQIERPLKWELSGCVLDALWSDPTDSDDWMNWGVHANEERGLGSGVTEFGPDVTAQFCRREGLSLIIRSHQYVRQGYKVMHGGHLITLFTARNYFGEVGQESNDGAMLLLAPDINGHLRVHPKRLVKLELESGSFRSNISKWMPCLAPCVYGLFGSSTPQQ